MTSSVWEIAQVGSLKHTSHVKKQVTQTHTREYSQLHDKVEVWFTFKDLFQRHNVGMFNPVRKKRTRIKWEINNNNYTRHFYLASSLSHDFCLQKGKKIPGCRRISLNVSQQVELGQSVYVPSTELHPAATCTSYWLETRLHCVVAHSCPNWLNSASPWDPWV